MSNFKQNRYSDPADPRADASSGAADPYPARKPVYYGQAQTVENEHNMRFWLVTLACCAIIQIVLGKWVLPGIYAEVIYSLLFTRLFIWLGAIIGFVGSFYYNTRISRYFNPFRRTVADYVFSPLVSLVLAVLFAVLVVVLKPIVTMLLWAVIIIVLISGLFRRRR